jgi:hypothetical protein
MVNAPIDPPEDAPNPLEHVRKLCVDRGAVWGKRRTMAVEAGIPPHVLENLFSPSKYPKRVPPAETMADIARALGCTYNAVWTAFNLDFHPEVTHRAVQEVHQILKNYGRSSEAGRVKLVQLSAQIAARFPA